MGTKLVIKHLNNPPTKYKSGDGSQNRRYIPSGKRLTETSSFKNQGVGQVLPESCVSKKSLAEGGSDVLSGNH